VSNESLDLFCHLDIAFNIFHASLTNATEPMPPRINAIPSFKNASPYSLAFCLSLIAAAFHVPILFINGSTSVETKYAKPNDKGNENKITEIAALEDDFFQNNPKRKMGFYDKISLSKLN
jgi:hypothetical protein